MSSLLDLAGLPPRTVSVRGVDLAVPGLSARGVAEVVSRFPALRTLFEGEGDVPAASLVTALPEACSAFIAAGLGHPGDRDHEAVAARLPLEAQLDLVEAILAESAPRGLGELLARLTALVRGIGAGLPAEAPPSTPSPPPSSG